MSLSTHNSLLDAPGTVAYRVRVKGHVQGVGFRPFVKRLAEELGLVGGVGNDSSGVFIEIDGEHPQVKVFLARLRSNAPETARIESIEAERVTSSPRHAFEIWPCPVEEPGPCRARVPRERAVCDLCLVETNDPLDRRFRYAFTTCTACGPRYSLLSRMPYERSATAMTAFPLCPVCAAEFDDVDDRRFHAEVMACPVCGPQVRSIDCGNNVTATDDDAVLQAAAALRRGDIVALKGLGGYQLLTRADDAGAVARLRERKQRPAKPLAIMVRSLADASRYAILSSAERELLASPENPIVLVTLRTDMMLAPNIAPHLRHVGLLLPTTPLHHRLLELVPFPVVATSGNRGEEPILGDDATTADLGSLADAVLAHNRPIARRLDDSVVRVIAGQPSSIRLARGFAPFPLVALERWLNRLGRNRPAGGVLALGGQQKNAVALWSGTQAILGPHLGDLESGRTRAAWRRHLAELATLYGTDIQTLVTDLHPDYAATRWADESGLSVIKVGHHHAHAAAAMIEHDLLDRTVLAFTWDGTGLGTDGNLWGGECLRVTIRESQRVGTLRTFSLPGGEAAIRDPWRIGLALCRDAFGSGFVPFWPEVPAKTAQAVTQLLDRRVHCPATTSLGRLFDGVASLLLGVSHVSYEGEAAARLEAIADPAVTDSYSVINDEPEKPARWDWRPMIRALVADRDSVVPVAVCAARFHNTVARWAQIVAISQPEIDVVLTGGCFQNALLTERVRDSLLAIGKRVHTPGLIPVNDGGLAAGQLAIGLGQQAAGHR